MKYLRLVCFVAYVVCLARVAYATELAEESKSTPGEVHSSSNDAPPHSHNSSASSASVLLAANSGSGGMDFASWSSYYKKSESKLDGVLVKCYDCINAEEKQNAQCEGAPSCYSFCYSFLFRSLLLFCFLFPLSSRVQQHNRPQSHQQRRHHYGGRLVSQCASRVGLATGPTAQTTRLLIRQIRLLEICGSGRERLC